MTGVPIEKLSVSGFELVFVLYPAMLSTLPYPHFWTIIFFLILMNIGLGTNYIYYVLLSEFISDLSQSLKGRSVSKRSVINDERLFYKKYTIALIFIILVINLALFASDAGIYWVLLFDHFS